MPSRKKAQGQARKAEKEKQQAEQARAQQRASCKHFVKPDNATQDDIDAAVSLLKEYVNGSKDITNARAITTLAFQTYHKYFQYSDVRKRVFRELILSLGTAQCVEEANEKDLTKKHTMRAWRFVILLADIEEMDKHQVSYDTHSMYTTICCPRETIRFFHRRNSCGCLHEVYYKLKDTTRRTFGCWNCKQLVDVKKALRCDCGIAKYCSNKCALEYWPKHKERCRLAKSFRFDI
jgi:hypothetical protein